MLKKLLITATLALTVCATPLSAFADTSGKTRYPIVLVHGLSGFDKLVFDYFYGIKPALANVGATKVYAPQLTAFNSSEARGEELVTYLENLKAITGAQKFNLIGHSQGGIDSRYAAAVKPSLVASVTSVGSPHRGSDTADFIKNSPLDSITIDIGNAIGDVLAFLSGDPSQKQNALGSMESLNSAGAAVYNQKYPQGLRQGQCKDVPRTNVGSWLFPKYVYDYSVNDGDRVVNGIRYYSWTGIYNPLVDSNVLDVGDAMLAITSLTFGEKNDGLVGRCSTHLGQVIRDDYTMNHLDEVNMLLGIQGLWNNDPVPLFTNHAKRLKNAGL